MAIAAATIYEIETAGSDNNGGGFDPSNANMATDLAGTSANTSAPSVTSASYTFVAGDVGAWLYIKSGTNWTPGWYQIASVAGGAATLTAGVGTAFLATNNTPVATNTSAGCATVASPTAGVWSIDYTQQTTAEFAYTDLVIGNPTTTQLTSAAHPFGVNLVGNIVNVTGGTGFTAGRYQVVSVSGTTATVDRAVGTAGSTGGTGNAGGALASVGQYGGVKVQGNSAFMKSGTYSLTTATANTSAGMLTDSTGGVDPTRVSYLAGYSTIRTVVNTDTKPLLQASGVISTFTMLNATGNHIEFYNLSVDCASKTSSTGISCGANYTRAIRCKAANATVKGINLADNSNEATAILCEATGCSGTAGIYIGTSGPAAIVCESHGNTIHGFQLGNSALAIFCLSYANTGASTDGFNGTSVGYRATNCVSYGNGRAGFDLTSNAGFGTFLTNSIAYGNTGAGFRSDAVKGGVFLFNCAGGGNASNYDSTQVVSVFNFQALTGNPFNNAAGGDFSLNNTGGAGGACRAAGIPGVYPAGTTTGYLDIGAVQHQDAGGSGSVLYYPGMDGGCNG